MRLKCLGSGSSGNCYILENDEEALVIEAGLPFKEVKRALDFNVRKIVGVIAGHSHLDHSKFLNEYKKAVISTYKPYDEAKAYPLSIQYGKFSIKAFRLVHDVPCYGFYITHPEMGTLIYASDTEYIKYRFKGLNHILVECNHDNRLVPKDAVNRSHVLSGHMELQITKEFIRVNNNPDLRNVVLLHLSASNADPATFQEETRQDVDCPVWIAKKGLEVDLRLVPF